MNVANLFPEHFLSWRQWSHHQKIHFLMNIFWGMVIAVALHFIHHTGPAHSVMNGVYDFLVTQDFIAATLKNNENGQPPVSNQIRIVAFDKQTYDSAENQGFWTPRLLLARSVLYSLKLGAKVVVLDFAVNRPVPVICRDTRCVNENIDFIKTMRQAVAIARRQRAVIILPFMRHDRSFPAFQKLLEQGKDVIKLALARGFLNPDDNKVRHFSLYSEIEQHEIIPSVELTALLFHRYSHTRAERLMQEISQALAHQEHHIMLPDHDSGKAEEITLCDPNQHGECLASRYLFRLAPRKVIASIFQDTPGGVKDPLITSPELLMTPASLLARKLDGPKIYNQKIVLIGSTNLEVGDIYATPIGPMPGIYLIANGLNVLMQGLQIHKPPTIIYYCMEVMIILAAALFFLHMNPPVATIVMAILILICLSPASIFLFSKYGLFVDFWFPVLGIGLHKIIAEGEYWLGEVTVKK